MTMGEGNQVGGAKFGLGIDFQQLERDLARAEALAKASAQRIQQQLGAIPIGGGGGAAPARTPVASAASGAAHAARPAAAPGARQAATAGVPPFVRDLFDQAVASGMSEEDARRSLAKVMGVSNSDFAGLGSQRGGARITTGEARRRMRGEQQRAERDARIEGRPFSVVSSGRVVGPRAAAAPRAPRDAALSRPGGGDGGGFIESLFATPGTEIRAAGALVGVGLGLSAAVGVAALLHQTVVKIVESVVRLEQGVRNVGISFGATARQFTGPAAEAFSANPQTAGSTEQFLGAVGTAGPLAAQFQLNTQQVQQLVTAEGVLARLHGVELPKAAEVLTDVLRGNLEAGQALGLQLTDQYGRLKSVGLGFDELVESVGRVRAEQILLLAIQDDVNRQLQNSADYVDPATRKIDDLAKHWQQLQDAITRGARGTANAVAEGDINPVAGFGRNLGARARTGQENPIIPTQAQIDKAITAQNAGLLENERIGGPAADIQRRAADRAQRSQAATDQAARAGVQQRTAQAQLDTLGAQSDLRRLAVQGQVNELAQARLDLEARLSPILLEQQQVQDRITLATRERLDLTEATLRAQQAAIAPQGAAADLSFAQQRVRLLAQIQQSRAIRGLGPAPGVAGVPELFNQALGLALVAPELNLGALDAGHAVDLATRAATTAQIGQRLSALPDQRRLQALQDQTIPLQQAQAAAKAAGDAIERSLQGADLVSSPAVVKAQQDLANARIQQADAAAKIAALQREVQGEAGLNVNARADVVIEGLTDVEAVATKVLDSFRPQLIAAINAAVNNPRAPSAPPADRGSR